MRLDYAADQRRGANSFDLLRLFGAGCVLFAHSFALTRSVEPFPARLREGWGSVGVIVFFSISGFLIARSWSYDPRPLSFAFKRALRLMPALLLSLLLTALVLGPIVTTLPVHVYFEHPATKAFVVSNATLQTFDGLPGVFTSNVYPNAVNGSLWTLQLEVKAYGMVLLLGLLGLYGRRRWVMPLVGIVIALLLIGPIRDAIPLGNRFVATLVNLQVSPIMVTQAHADYFRQSAEPFAAFAIGASLFSVARWIPLRWSVAALLAAVYAAAIAKGGNTPPILLAWLMPYFVLILAFRTSHLVRLPARFGDYSYGLYIVAFPVQQTVSQVLSPSSGWVMFLISAPLTLVFAVASWHLVEAPALTLKQRLARPLAVATHDARHPPERVALDATPIGDVVGPDPSGQMGTTATTS